MSCLRSREPTVVRLKTGDGWFTVPRERLRRYTLLPTAILKLQGTLRGPVGLPILGPPLVPFDHFFGGGSPY